MIGWGAKPSTLFTEVDAAGRVLLNVTFPAGHAPYRVIKVAPGALDQQQLRLAAGLPRFVPQLAPTVNFVVPGRAPASGPGSVTITGTGFTGATSLTFGSKSAPAFTINADNLITATAPAGCGTVIVLVSGSGETSSNFPVNQLLVTASDSSFESGTGSWSGAVTSNISLSSSYARSGLYSLQISPRAPGSASAQTGVYLVQGGAQVIGKARVLTPFGADQIQALLTFYDSSGATLASEEGPIVTASTQHWVEVSETVTAPVGAASMALKVSNESASGPTYVDDAALGGIPEYVYLPMSTKCRSDS